MQHSRLGFSTVMDYRLLMRCLGEYGRGYPVVVAVVAGFIQPHENRWTATIGKEKELFAKENEVLPVPLDRAIDSSHSHLPRDKVPPPMPTYSAPTLPRRGYLNPSTSAPATVMRLRSCFLTISSSASNTLFSPSLSPPLPPPPVSRRSRASPVPPMCPPTFAD